jgi:hypothetical protein
MIDHACAGVDCQIKDKCQRYVLHLQARASAEKGVEQWYNTPVDPKNCSFFVKKYPVPTKD